MTKRKKKKINDSDDAFNAKLRPCEDKDHDVENITSEMGPGYFKESYLENTAKETHPKACCSCSAEVTTNKTFYNKLDEGEKKKWTLVTNKNPFKACAKVAIAQHPCGYAICTMCYNEILMNGDATKRRHDVFEPLQPGEKRMEDGTITGV